jgi:PIN domain nuclease of toxin-antitoxin system
MNLLLDTHIWIWSDLEPGRLSADVHLALSSSKNELWLSPVSIWEVTVLLQKRRISLPEQFHDWLEESVQALRLREVALTWRIAAELQTLAIGHDDPADRFLVATAKVFDLTLVTADERLIEAPGLKVLANR